MGPAGEVIVRVRQVLVGVMALGVAACVAAQQAPSRTYKMLRWEEDWSWLSRQPPADKDAFDSVKFVELGDDWHFLFGGSARIRFESDDNKTLGASPFEDDDLTRVRGFLHWEIGRPQFRWFSEVRYSDTLGSDRPVSGTWRDDPDFQNFFLEGTFGSATKHPVSVRVGRQELLFGVERVVGPLDWSNTRRTWDGISVTAKTQRSKTVVFSVLPVEHEIHDIDSPEDHRIFSGVNWTFKANPANTFEAYAFGLHDSRNTFAGDDGAKDDVTLMTYGGRYVLDAKKGAWVDVEANVQDGNWGTNDVSAWSVTATAGYQWKDAAWKPKVTGGFDVATGDDDPKDGERGTFTQLFPTGHPWLGHLDLVGRQNVRSARARFEAQPLKGMKLDAALHRFWLEEETDALYDAGGAVLRAAPATTAGKDVATELDLWVSYTFAVHHTFAAEVARWWSGDFIEGTGSGKDVTWFWIGYEFKF